MVGMLKCCILIGSLIMWSHVALTQNTFSVLFQKTNSTDSPDMMIENSTHDYIAVGTFLNEWTLQNSAGIWIIKNNGDTMSKEYRFNDSTSIFAYIEQIPNGNYKVLGSIMHPPDYFSDLLILELDGNFNIVNQKVIQLPGMETFYSWKMKRFLNSYYLLASTAGPTSTPTWIGDPYFIKFNSEFDTIQTHHLKLSGRQAIDDFIVAHDSSHLIAFAGSYIPQPSGYGKNNEVYIDTNLNITGYRLFSVRFDTFQADWITDSTFLLACNSYTTPDYLYNQCFLKTDTLMQIFQEQQFGIPDTNDWRALLTTFVRDSTGNIYFLGSKNGIPTFWPTEPSWLRVGMMNSSFEPVFERFYGGDAYYLPMLVIRTSDSGLLIYAKRYDWNNHLNFNDAFFLKVNSEGLLTGVPDEHICPYKPFTLSPNPGNSYFEIKLILPEAILKLTDLSGKTLFSKQIVQGNTMVDCTGFPLGIYLVTIVNPNGDVFTQKWIKQ